MVGAAEAFVAFTTSPVTYPTLAMLASASPTPGFYFAYDGSSTSFGSETSYVSWNGSDASVRW